MFKFIISWIAKRLTYANTTSLLKSLLDGVDEEDVKKMFKVVDGHLNDKLNDDPSCDFNSVSVTDIFRGTPVVIQDNRLVRFTAFKIEFDAGKWVMWIKSNGEFVQVHEDDHTKIYFLL